MIRANRVPDLAEQEYLQAACIPGACDGNMSNCFMIYGGKTGPEKKFYHNVVPGED